MKKLDFDSYVLTIEVCDYIFVEWLIRRNLYSRFVANLLPVKSDLKSPRAAIRDLVADLITSPRHTLANAFSVSFPFQSTSEGRDFWLRASKDWESYLDSFSHVI